MLFVVVFMIGVVVQPGQIPIPIGTDETHPLIIEPGQAKLPKKVWRHIQCVAFVSSLGPPVTLIKDADVDVLKGRANIKSVRLSDSSRVTDRVVGILRTLPHLKHVEFERVNVTNEGLKALATISSLERITVRNCPISDAGVGYLAKLPRLKSLAVEQCPIFGTCLGQLEKAKSLRKLSFSETNVDDGISDDIANMKQLTELDLSYTEITEITLAALTKLKTLKQLNLWASASREAIEAFRRQRPQIVVHSKFR